MAQEQSAVSASALLLDLDDTSLSALIHHDIDDHEDEIHIDPTMISDAKYAEELQLQEAIMASSAFISQNISNIASCSSSSLTIQAAQAVPSSATHEVLDPETQTLCGICVEVKENNQMFSNESCAHSFCSDCITRQVAAKLDESFHIVSCPGLDCKAVLKFEDCTPILPKLVLERWNGALCEALFVGSQKLYCPFSDCSMVLVIENEGEAVRESECPACHRLFCAGCQVPWHSGVDCEEFQMLNEDERGREDLMVNQLAKEKKWKRCPRCHFYVEKTQGCLHISCRCQFQFCYGCGAEWTSNHGGCQSQCNRN
ncbi:putative aminoacyltransferase, E1 ubiquitin-activating enzyme [Rosa chinensis]|uniref:RBR-type E3 ubiquitin transferase n=1 Tax=Rosa chinensis TaxID=74649 RepID=A0A2P6RV23_ROSCH|nr:E3 ubiquitin-protein ligase ARIH2 [Rosa chinensis]PRQ50285.1 putative aminoacyltransferase, E1 ubiquitin-activating enzyme [Rosa chinensis]